MSNSIKTLINNREVSLEVKSRDVFFDYSIILNRPDIFGEKLNLKIQNTGIPEIDICPIHEKNLVTFLLTLKYHYMGRLKIS